jgi:hypothetical protein
MLERLVALSSLLDRWQPGLKGKIQKGIGLEGGGDLMFRRLDDCKAQWRILDFVEWGMGGMVEL